jgi:uncharacterized protein
MIALDTNLLVYAHRADSPFHARASESIATLANGRAAWAILWPCLHEFFAIVTHPLIYAPPTPQPLAVDQIEAWLESPSLTLLAESGAHWPELRTLIEAGQIVGPRYMTPASPRCAWNTVCGNSGRPIATSVVFRACAS